MAEEFELGRARRGSGGDTIRTRGGGSGGGGGKSHQPSGGGGYHCSVKTHSRGGGHSATAAIAYRAGERIIDERTGEVHDYTKKQGVEHREIVLPEGAPEWAADRSALWNAVEQAETRKNSTVAREWEVSIPYGLTKDQAADLVRGYAQEIVKRHGIAVDFAIHQDNGKTWEGKEKAENGYHAHILGTTRRLGRDGFTDKTRELDGPTGQGKEQVKHWRQQWAEMGADRLRALGRNIEAERWRAGHLTLGEQRAAALARNDKEWAARLDGRTPTRHLGPKATAMERRGEATELGRHNRGLSSEIVLPEKSRLLPAKSELLPEKRGKLRRESRLLPEKSSLLPSGADMPRAKMDVPQQKTGMPRAKMDVPQPENGMPQNAQRATLKELQRQADKDLKALPDKLMAPPNREQIGAELKAQIGGQELKDARHNAEQLRRAAKEAERRLERQRKDTEAKGLLSKLFSRGRDNQTTQQLERLAMEAAAAAQDGQRHLDAIEAHIRPEVERLTEKAYQERRQEYEARREGRDYRRTIQRAQEVLDRLGNKALSESVEVKRDEKGRVDYKAMQPAIEQAGKAQAERMKGMSNAERLALKRETREHHKSQGMERGR